MPVRTDLGSLREIASATQTIASNGTVAFDFGTPNDINLAGNTNYKHGDRVLVVLSAKRAAGTTSTLTFTIQDADDNAGSIGTPATAATVGAVPAFAADSGAVDQSVAIALQVKSDRPWLRVNAVHGVAGTDSFQCHCTVFAVPSAGL